MRSPPRGVISDLSEMSDELCDVNGTDPIVSGVDIDDCEHDVLNTEFFLNAFAVTDLEQLKVLEKKSGAPFSYHTHTLHSQNHKQVSNPRLLANKFLSTDLSNKHCFLEFPESMFDPCIQHYVRTKTKFPQTSACIMVPKRKGRWSRYIGQWKLVHTIPMNTPCLIDPISKRTVGAHLETMDIYFDAPKPSMAFGASLRDNWARLRHVYPCVLDQFRTHVLADSGATHNFMDPAFAESCGFHVKPETGHVNCGGNTTSAIVGTCKPLLQLGPFRKRVTFTITKTPAGIPVILGNAWLNFYQAELCHGHRVSLKIKVDGKLIKICNPADSEFKEGGMAHNAVLFSEDMPRIPLIGSVSAMELIRDGEMPFVLCVKQAKTNTNSDLPDISWEEQSIQDEFQDRFVSLPPGLPPERSAPFRIHLKDTKPIHSRGYRLTPMEREQVEAQIKEYLEKGWIRPSESPYSAAVLFVQKKDGTLRMCVDYRGLNNVTVKDRYPLPRIDDLIDRLHGAIVFSSLDLQSGYHQIRIADEDVHKTAFTTHKGLFEYRVMPFGLCNAPSAFQRQMNKMLGHLPFAVVYLDDILVFSKSREEHISHLRIVLGILREHDFYAKLSKCSFFQDSTKFLGYVVDRDGISMDPDKVSAVREWPQPTSVSELRSFLGLCNHYKRFIEGYSIKIAPLNELTKASVPFNLKINPAARQSFEWLKNTITTAPVLAIPNLEAPYFVVTDASGYGIGAVLLQEDLTKPDKPKRPIAFHSARLSSAEQNYPVGEQELLAVVSALKKWRCYLEGAKGGVTVITDHQPNTFLDTKSAEQFSRRQARWQLELSRISPTWVYEKGVSNAADPLSRCPSLQNVSMPQASACAQTVMETIPVRVIATTGAYALRYKPRTQGCSNGYSLASMKMGVDSAETVYLGVSAGIPGPDGVPELMKDIAEWFRFNEDFEQEHRLSKNYTYRDGVWRYRDLILVPEDDTLRQRCIALHHNVPAAGHPGRAVTLDLVQRHFWWPSVRRDVQEFVTKCHSCQTMKSQTQKPAGLLQPLPIPNYPWQSVSMDFITHLPTTERGFTSIVVFVDRLTKMAIFCACHDTDNAEQFAQIFVDQIFRRFGLPEDFVSDRDTRFTSKFMREVCKQLCITQSMSTAHHPQTDGQTERTNRTLAEMLRHFVNPSQNDWDLKLPCAEFAYNNARKAATGYTPFELNYGRHPRSPSTVEVNSLVPEASEFVEKVNDAISRARGCLQSAQARMKKLADTKRRDVEFSVGDEVLLSTKYLKVQNTRKLAHRWIGPFPVVRRIGATAYELDLPGTMPANRHDVFHVSLLKPYTHDPNKPPPPVPNFQGTEPEWEIESILDYRDVQISAKSRKTKREFLVKWLGWGHESNSWQPESDFKHARDTVEKFYLSRELAGPKSA